MNRRRIAAALVAAAIAIAGAIAAIAAIVGDETIDPPELGGSLVELRAFDRCVRDSPAPTPGWRISGEFVNDRKVPAGAGAGGFQLAWTDPDANRTSSARALVVASAAAAEEIASRFPDQVAKGLDEGPGYGTDRWGNLLFRSYDGSYRAKPPGEVVELITGCAERAATREPVDAEMTECKSPKRTGVFARQFVRAPSVRGLSCAEAERLLRRAVEGPTGTCGDFGPGFACFTEFYCCSAPTEYAGNGDVELVWDGGF